ncbi:Negative regulator of mitotic exit [Podila epigama]|nr:Negative regulator of mitotic exit [Podila epigama]
MAGLFSKKSKKDKEDRKTASTSATSSKDATASTNTSSTQPPTSTTGPGKGKDNSTNGPFRDNSSANNSITNSTHHSTSSVQPPAGLGGQAGSTSDSLDKSGQRLYQQHQVNSQHSHTFSSSSNGFSSIHSNSNNNIGQHYTINNNGISPHNSITNLSTASTTGPWVSSAVVSTNPFPRFSHTASYVHTGTDIYVFGGIVKGSGQKDMHIIDSQSLHCQYLPVAGSDSPPATSGHTAVTLGQYIMYFGGKDVKNKSSDSLYVLHTVRKEWNKPSLQGLLPAPRHSHAAAVIGTTMFIFGGQFNGYYFNDICSFDMKTLNTPNPKWIRLEPASELPPARAGHCAAAHDGKIYIFGGADEQYFYNDIWCYDPQVNKWEAVPAFGVLPTSRQGHAACVVDDTMYIYGGMNHEDQLLGDLSAFKFNERRWLTYPDTLDSAPPRTEHAMCSVGDKIYILGGQLELNAEEDSSIIYILDTSKIRFNDPSIPRYEGSIESSTLRLEERRTPSPDSIRHINDYNHDPRRPTHIQTQSIDTSDMHNISNGVHPASARSPVLMSHEGLDGNPVTRRRTTGKPAGHREPETEVTRATHSIDETRRTGGVNVINDSYERDSSRGSIQRHQHQLYHNHNHNHHHQQEQEDGRRRRSLSESRNRNSYNASCSSLEQSTRGPSQQNSLEHLANGPASGPTKDSEIRELRQREQWLMAEVAMARKKMGSSPNSFGHDFAEDTSNLAAAIALQNEMGAYDAEQDSEKYRIMQALLSVKAELERSKTSIVQQAQVASNKLREAERVRTAALQEAAYLKAKVSALQSGEVSLLASTETARAVDLEKRLTTALAQVDRLQSQLSQSEAVSERERHAREMAQEREREASARVQEVEEAHSRSLTEVASLHERASAAEAKLRECEAKNAANEAGLSSYQQQSTALFSQISALKTTVEHQKKSLEKAKLAYSVANDRAEHADRGWIQARQEIDSTQLEFASVRAELDRAQRESDHWKAKAQETELLWQKAKGENEAMRALLEDDMNAAAASSSSNASSPSSYSPNSNSRKHDSIMAITSASRVAELEHELGTLRHLLRESQGAAAQANKSLNETMIRISELEKAVMIARNEASTAQRQLSVAEDKIAELESQLGQKEEALDEMAKEQENNEVQLGVLRGVMRENGLLADDLILEALSLGTDGQPVGVPSAKAGPNTVAGLKVKVQEAEKRAQEAEERLEELNRVKTLQEERIQQLETDYQTALQYAQGTETSLQKLRDDAKTAESEKETLHAHFKELEDAHGQCSQGLAQVKAEATASNAQLEDEVADLHRQLNDALGRTMELEQKLEGVMQQLQASEQNAESVQVEFRTLKAKHHEHKKQGALQSEGFTARLEQMEASLEETMASLAETRESLETAHYELEQAHELNKSTLKELDETLATKATLEKELKKAQEVELRSNTDAVSQKQKEELEQALESCQQTIQVLQATNQDLEGQLRASEHKISILLDNIQGPDSVRNSMASLSGGSDDSIMRLMEGAHHEMPSQRSSVALQEQYQQQIEQAEQSQQQKQERQQSEDQQQEQQNKHLKTPMSHGSHLTDRSSADSLANELELLKTPWGQAQIHGDAYLPGVAALKSPPMSPATSTKSKESSGSALASPTASTNGSSLATPSTSTSPTTTTTSTTANTALTPAQKLEEYERMIEDMANQRRQYEE